VEDIMRYLLAGAALLMLAACGGHHGQILHQDRPGGTDFNAAQGKK
jgi:hypothetical protein